jgi:hypothetical protein
VSELLPREVERRKAFEYARAAAREAMKAAQAHLGKRWARTGSRPVPGLFTCPECGRSNLQVITDGTEDGEVVHRLYAHLGVSPWSGLGRCDGSHGPGELQE